MTNKGHVTQQFMVGHPKQPAPAGRRKIFMVEDHPTFCEGLGQILNGEPDLVVCGEAGTAKEALSQITRLRPDLVLVDITLPDKSGLELIKELRQSGSKTKLLVLSMHDEALYAARVLRAGGDGYIMKQEDPEEIIRAIRDVLAGRIYVSEDVLASSPGAPRRRRSAGKRRPFDELTDQELEILNLLGRGKTNREIARQLKLSSTAVNAGCTGIKQKLKLKSGNALIRYAVCWVETGKT